MKLLLWQGRDNPGVTATVTCSRAVGGPVACLTSLVCMALHPLHCCALALLYTDASCSVKASPPTPGHLHHRCSFPVLKHALLLLDMAHGDCMNKTGVTRTQEREAQGSIWCKRAG